MTLYLNNDEQGILLTGATHTIAFVNGVNSGFEMNLDASVDIDTVAQRFNSSSITSVVIKNSNNETIYTNTTYTGTISEFQEIINENEVNKVLRLIQTFDN